jgi:glycosyltransferase involved in cell wall biosynthesis
MEYTAPLNKLSYGYVGFYFLKGLVDCGLVPKINVMGTVELENDYINKYMPYIDNLYSQTISKDISLLIYHEFNLQHNNNAPYKIGFPIFEMDNLKYCSDHIEQQDCIFVCSEWAKNVVLNTTKQKNVEIVHLGYNDILFNNTKWVQDGPLKFYTIGKWEYRKGHDVILKAFNGAFSNRDNVELHMLSNLQFPHMDKLNKHWSDLYMNSKLNNKIHIHDTLQNQSDVAEFINNNHVGLFLSRAEGWNMGLLESLACGRPCIATDYSGQSEYIKDFEHANIVHINNYEDAIDNVWFNKDRQSRWAQFTEDNLDHTIAMMRSLYKRFKHGDLHPYYCNHNKYTWIEASKRLNSLVS